MICFFDSSALAKRYLNEAGSQWVRAHTYPSSGHIAIIGHITRVEIVAAIARRQRDPAAKLTIGERDRLIGLFERHLANGHYTVVKTKPAIIDVAAVLPRQYKLRGYDAVQLATALVANTSVIARGFQPLALVSADKELLAAALAIGLNTVDVRQYR